MKPNIAQKATPIVNRTYIKSDIPLVSWLLIVLMAWGRKLSVVKIAAIELMIISRVMENCRMNWLENLFIAYILPAFKNRESQGD